MSVSSESTRSDSFASDHDEMSENEESDQSSSQTTFFDHENDVSVDSQVSVPIVT
jgi:hypothetical protein